MKTVINPNSTSDPTTLSGTLGGTALAIIANLGLQDYVSTIILAALGAEVSFVVTKILKVAWDWIKGK